MSQLGSDYGAYARVPLCRACGNPHVPPGVNGCCSQRCVDYLEVARQPVLGDPLFGPQQNMLCRGGCGVRFDSRGLVLCVDCYFRAHPPSECEIVTKPLGHPYGRGAEVGLAPARTYGPTNDHNPRSRCFW